MDKVAHFETHGAYISRRFAALISSRDLSRGGGGGPHNKRNGNVSRYFLPRFFLSTTDALRTEPRRSNNGWWGKRKLVVPRKFIAKPLAPIYKHTASGWSLRNEGTRQHIPRRENGWLCYCGSFHCGNDLVGLRVSRKSWKWNWWRGKAAIRSVVIIWGEERLDLDGLWFWRIF